jgi:hypothetical protein
MKRQSRAVAVANKKPSRATGYSGRPWSIINPAAFGIGILGNLSPQQSPLNKPLQGVSSTQRSGAKHATRRDYSDAERPDCVAGHVGLEVRRETGKE